MGTAALVLIFDDPDAANWPHWAVLNIPPEESGLAAGLSGYGLESELPAGAEELENGAGYAGYYGSCPPRAHVYRWRLWAVDQALTAPAEGGAKARFLELAEQAEAHALGGAELCHIYDPRG
jgi:Raf kinase inhibitor-like YbhB/YbcL family protein